MEKFTKAKEILEKAGIKFTASEWTDGTGGILKFTVSQGGKERQAEYRFDGDKVEGSKYVYLLPNDLDDAIESL